MAVVLDLKDLPNRLWSQASKPAWRMRQSIYDALIPIAKQAASRTRSRHLFVLDAIGLTLASWIALVMWTEGRTTGDGMMYWWAVALVVAVRCTVGLMLKLYQHSWRFASVPDMGRIACCVGLGSLAAVAIVNLGGWAAGQQGSVPASEYWVVEAMLAFAVIATPRFAIRGISEMPSRLLGRTASSANRTLLYGAGWAGVMIARSMQRGADTGLVPVGFLDDDRDIEGRRISGLPVFGGLEAMGRATRRSKATSLLVTMPSASGASIRRVVEAAMDLGLQVRTVPPVTDLLDGTLDATRVRSVRVEDLLRRPLAAEHAPQVKMLFQGRTVLITGAGGSIGSELARQVLAVGPKRIVLVDRAESALYMIHREIEERRSEGLTHGAQWEDVEVGSHLANVVSRPMMQRLFEQERPDIVFHAAAYKHVPLLEDHPSEAVQVNIAGTLSLVDAAVSTGVQRFVLVSTDKAVAPSSVMGATKRFAEMLVTDAAKRLGQPYISVRFGNVLGSNGSVVPIFQAQLERGQPLTITSPEMTRYFMTIPEAAWLLLDAAALAERGGLYVLDMGEPVKIIDVARDLIRLAGRDPDSVPIRVIGLRKGEKLHEELFYDKERAQPTAVSKVLHVEAPGSPESIRDTAQDLIALSNGLKEDDLRRILHERVSMADAPDSVAPTQDPRPAAGQVRRAIIPISVPLSPRMETARHGGLANDGANL